MTKEHPKLTAEEKREQYKKKWDELNIQLGAGEFAVQIEEGGGKYFLTNRARIFSVAKWGTEWRELKQSTKQSENAKNKYAGSNQQLMAGLSLGHGLMRTDRVSKLMAENFELQQWNPYEEEKLEVHHKQRWTPEDGTYNNRVENLMQTGKKAHRTLTAIQDGQLTEDGLEYKNNRAVWKKIADTPAPFGFVNIFISKIDPETKLVVSVEAKQITDEEALKLVNGEMTLQEAILAADDRYKKKLQKQEKEEAEAMKLIAAGEATGKVRVVNGHLQLVKEKKGKKAE